MQGATRARQVRTLHRSTPIHRACFVQPEQRRAARQSTTRLSWLTVGARTQEIHRPRGAPGPLCRKPSCDLAHVLLVDPCPVAAVFPLARDGCVLARLSARSSSLYPSPAMTVSKSSNVGMVVTMSSMVKSHSRPAKLKRCAHASAQRAKAGGVSTLGLITHANNARLPGCTARRDAWRSASTCLIALLPPPVCRPRL